MTKFKSCGFTFTHDQISEFGKKIYGDRIKEPNEMSGVFALNVLSKQNNLGSLRGIVIPKSIEVPGALKRDGFCRGYFLVFDSEPLTNGETVEDFKPIPFKDNDNMERILGWFSGHGYTREEMQERWNTFSEWSFTEHIESEADG
ncbi:hypothetical protein ACEPAG_8401 [Sanghuangporus baumii]